MDASVRSGTYSTAVDAAAAYAREARKAPALTASTRPSIEESKWQSKRYGCFCGTDRHLPTTPLPFEGAWVQCDGCERWCHGECAGLSLEEAEEVEAYRCPVCAGRPVRRAAEPRKSPLAEAQERAQVCSSA